MNEEIRQQLSTNLEEYEKNQVLNKLTPSRTRNVSDEVNSSGRRSRRLGSISKRRTPKRVIRPSNQNDSLIATSPVKARRYASSEEDEYDTSRHSSTVNIPLRDSPKRKMRQGTPKLLSSKPSQTEPTITMKSKSFTFKEAKSILADDEFDDDDDDNVSDTILSDIPSDLLSPEKHTYPAENVRSVRKESSVKSVWRSSPRAMGTVKPVIYPSLSPASSTISSQVKSILFPPRPSVIGTLTNDTAEDTSKPTLAPISKSTITHTRKLTSLITAQIEREPVLIQEDLPKEKSSPRRRADTVSQPGLNLSRYDSSGDEPSVPELTVKLAPLEATMEKRLLDEEHISQSKRAKTSIYPSLPSEHNRSETSARISHILDSSSPQKVELKISEASGGHLNGPLYPMLPISRNEDKVTPPGKVIRTVSNPKSQQETPKAKSTSESINRITHSIEKMASNGPPTLPSLLPLRYEKNTTERSNSTVRRSEVILDPPPKMKGITPVSKPRFSAPHTLYSEVGKHRQAESSQSKDIIENGNTPSEELIEKLGDPDNWTKNQWLRFLKHFKEFESQGHDFEVFTPEVLSYLKCDEQELILKIGFYKEYEESIKKGELR
jgi:hypothetical protein